jgi:hypothetical protein
LVNTDREIKKGEPETVRLFCIIFLSSVSEIPMSFDPDNLNVRNQPEGSPILTKEMCGSPIRLFFHNWIRDLNVRISEPTGSDVKLDSLILTKCAESAGGISDPDQRNVRMSPEGSLILC